MHLGKVALISSVKFRFSAHSSFRNESLSKVYNHAKGGHVLVVNLIWAGFTYKDYFGKKYERSIFFNEREHV